MKKNESFRYSKLLGIRKKWLIAMKTFILLVVFSIQLNASVLSQQRLSLKMNNVSAKELIKEIELQTNLGFIYNLAEIEKLDGLSIDVDQHTVEEILNEVLDGTDLTYEIDKSVIIIMPKPVVHEINVQQEKRVIRGKVTDDKGEPIPGVNIIILESKTGTVTNIDGIYEIKVPEGDVNLSFTFIGFQKQTIVVGERTEINIQLKTDISELNDVVVTGYYNQTKESFTGAATTIKSEELKAVSNNNILEAIQVFDPSFKIMENNEFGSNPNRMPEIEVRGKASFPGVSENELRSNPNQPTFILDGFEVPIEKIYDMDINRIASVTILKDASATAIYGSRAANGVIVMETIAPQKGRIQVNYTFDGTINTPDMSDYNMLNAEDKLEAERLAGLYTGATYQDQLRLDGIYNEHLQDVRSGVNTDWLSQPLATTFSHKHSLFVEGGNDAIRYGIEGNYNDEKGVMKESGRKRYNVGSLLSYRYKNILFKNQLTLTKMIGKESPYGNFSDYTMLNAYYKLKDENGRYVQVLGDNPSLLSSQQQYSPLYDGKYLSNKNESRYLNVTNNFSIDWTIMDGLRLKGNLSVQLQNDKSEVFKSPESIAFINAKVEDYNLRGSYQSIDSEKSTVDGNLVLSYFKQIDKHFVNAVLGGNIFETQINQDGYTAQGFANDRLIHPSFAAQFKEKSTPVGYESTSRLAGAFSNVNYNYDNRYLADLSLRVDGSSKFGSKQRSAPFWSGGIGWNIHNEAFFKKNDRVNEIRIRANMGETGGESFYAYQALTTYKYITDRHYRFQNGAVMKALGNEDLQWQTTLKRNIGLDLAFFKSRLILKGNYYHDTTKGMLSQISIAPSMGFPSFTSNMGNVLNKGFELSFSGTPYRDVEKNITVNLFANVRHNKNSIEKISEGLKQYNDEVTKRQNDEIENKNNYEKDELQSTRSVLQFNEGESLYAIYAVPSLGIDPATGKEVYVNRFGARTYDWDARDQVTVGESQPKYEGFFGTNTNIGRFSFNLSFNYQLGGQIYNQTLLDRVENANIYYNVDERVLAERWKKPGDIVAYKSIKDKGITRASSRFVEDENTLTLSSARCSYQFDTKIAKKLGMRYLKISMYMNDVFRLSTVKRERGTTYPFARSFSFSLQTKF